ncbi:MAG: hypothetical protein HN729_05590 [Candidatus Marinimicrobia bacterium]|nr:hypothetical protein [Candidatus Neomarinimicrobiota bacterium]MBT3634352.1 hypothetical protein [Candidatus Neomarinimicrobiota bacterium]MBT3681739.1 hypothetical protein [Candidatus Neomarinimicrobiota bacterium]MBT3759465.1 hypothetical protein [Candidatus Neomarinimicrobiota bacterium]MBT3895953.1 hypothetical protein [Candidatus Neomarinimicrobiota bacterium]
MDKFCSTVLVFTSVLLGQIQVGNWESHTSLLTPRSFLFAENGDILAATAGGILKLDPFSQSFDKYTDADGFVYLDLNTISKTAAGNYILGGNYPNGSLQVFHPDHGLIDVIDHLGIEEIQKVEMNSEYLVASCLVNNLPSIALFFFDSSGRLVFQDIFNQFPISVNNILDIDIESNTIYLVTDNGVIIGDLDDILNFSGSWEILFEGQDAYQIVIKNNIVWLITSDSVSFYLSDNWIPIIINDFDGLLDAKISTESDTMSLLTGDEYIEIDIDSGDIILQLSIPVNSTYTCMNFNTDTIILGLKRHGIQLVERSSQISNVRVPQTLISNRFHSLYYSSKNLLIGHSNDPAGIPVNERISAVMIMDEDHNYQHIISENRSVGYLLNDDDPLSFTGYTIDWVQGGAGSGGLSYTTDQKILIGLNGVLPNNPDRKGGIVEIDPLSMEFTIFDTTDGVLDGQFGIVDDNNGSRFISIHGIERDSFSNDWVINPYSEKYNHPAAIRLPDGSWGHITAPDTTSYLPQSITFDSQKRAWIGFQQYFNWSSGGIKVVDTRLTYHDESDDIWYPVYFNEPPPGNNIWDLAFDKMGLLWIIAGGGVQGYQISESGGFFNLYPVYPTDYFTYLPFQQGDKIIVDEMNNKWIITRHSGIRIITESTLTWPDDQGFTSSNSPLLSDIVYDAAIDNDQGIIYFATDKGISSMKIYYDDSINKSSENLGVSPNPFISGTGNNLVIDRCPVGSKVLVMTLSGAVVAKLDAQYEGLKSTQAIWDGKNRNGSYASSGIYLITAIGEEGKTKSAKVAVIRQ